MSVPSSRTGHEQDACRKGISLVGGASIHQVPYEENRAALRVQGSVREGDDDRGGVEERVRVAHVPGDLTEHACSADGSGDALPDARGLVAERIAERGETA